ncbi:MYXO-CTERM sorting domain-containing protein [Mesorhizobium sp.]
MTGCSGCSPPIATAMAALPILWWSSTRRS